MDFNIHEPEFPSVEIDYACGLLPYNSPEFHHLAADNRS